MAKLQYQTKWVEITPAEPVPTGAVVLLWDGRSLVGPRQHATEQDVAEAVTNLRPTHFMVIPKPL